MPFHHPGYLFKNYISQVITTIITPGNDTLRIDTQFNSIALVRSDEATTLTLKLVV